MPGSLDAVALFANLPDGRARGYIITPIGIYKQLIQFYTVL
jgi:hypothetical protein